MTVLRLPLIVPIPDISVAVGSAYTGPTPSLYQGAEPINWALSSGPAGMTINNTTGVVSWPTVISGGPYAVIIEASNIVGSDTEAWQITVVEPPVIADIANMTIASGVPFTSPAAVLLGGTEVSWSLDDGPAGMTINPSTGAVSWSSPVSLPTPYNITVRATNIAGTDTKTWQLTVLDKPLIADVADHNAIEMIPYLGPLPVLDAGASPITWSLVTAPAGMTINTATGQVQWPNPVVAGSPHNITIRAENEVGSDDEAWQLQVPPSYGAEVWAGVETAVSPEPVTLSGQAYWLDSDINAPNVPVRVDILVKGISRNIALTADSNGQFTTTLVPLPGEGGVYHIGASHLYGVHTTDQDSFTIYGMRSAPATRNIWLYPSQPVSGTITLTNLTDVPLSGIIADVNGAAGNLDIQLDYDPNMSELAVIDVNYTITALDDSVLSSTVVINFSSNEGATASTTLNVNVIPLNFVVNVSPQSLKTGMVRGQQKLLQFDLSNSGGAPTGQLDVLIPQVPWLRLTTPQKIPQIGPGQTAAVGLALEPAENLPLGLYTGTIIVYGVGVNKVIPFEFNCISDKVGTLEITVVDEFTFYAAGAPNVEGASMTLRDVVTQNLAWAETTDVNGVLINENVTEGYYNLRITAEDHGSYNATVFVAAGTETEITAFMPRQLVKYSWTVTPTVIEDKYNITLNTIFETSVPAPVITISPARVDLAQLQNGMMQVNFVITNHGLVAAEEAHLEFEEDSRYEVVLLTDYNGRVEPQSSITVPAMIIDTEHPAMQPESSMIALETVSDDENCDTHFTGSVTYTIVCGDDKKWHYVPVYVGFWVCPGRKVKEVTRPNPPPPTPGGQDEDDEDDGGDDEPPGSTGGGTGSSTQKGGGGGVVGGGGGGGGGSGPGNPTVTYNFTEVDIEGSACDPCPAKRLAAIANCAVSFLPLNCPLTLVKGAYECASSCTTSGVWSLNCLKNCTGAVVGGVASCVKDLSPIGVAWNVIWCVIDIATACDSSSAPAYAEAVTHYSQLINHYYSTDMPPDPEYAAEVLKEQGARLQNIMEAITDIFGDPAWFSVDPCESGIQADLIEAFSLAIDAAGDANEWISEDEKAAMFVMPIPSNMTIADVNNTCERWNRTLDYWETGVFTASDLDPNANPDFIGADVYQSNWEMAADSAQECIDDGFTDILDGVDSALEDLEVALSSPSEGVCAKVALEVTQEAVMSRSAFEAVLDLTNQGESSLDNLLVVIDIEDANGNDSSDLFGIYPPTLSGISAVDGTADLPGGSNMKAEWIILPTSQAAPLEPVDYYIGGQIIYSIDGLEVILPLLPDKITVTPDANLVLDYFYQKEVYADDPFTEEVIEPNEPFSLGLIMSNNGAGAAYDVTIASAQPQIIRHEEDKDILVDFSLIGTQVGSAEMTPSLTVDLGDIAPYSTAVARWLMVSSLQGEFTSYNASFEHVDPLGDPRLSLISGINVHELIHVVRADYPADNNIVDFLVNDINDANGMPDTLYLDDGTIEPVDVFAGMVLDVNEQPTTVTVELSASVGSGWNYIRVPNPVEDGFYLVSATRSDSKPILTGYNAWVTNRVIREQDEEPYNERLIHIFDYAGSGSYTLIFGHEPIHGSLRVVLSPTEAVAAGAQWKLDDGSWMDSNDILDGISSGIHTVSFKEINDWIAPASGDVLITAGYTQELSASYLPAAAPVGSLVVTIEPQAAIDDGAYWQIDGSPIQYDSGDVVTGLATGTHSLTFASVEGWNEPNGQEVIIEAYQTTAASGVYTRIMYTLTVSADDSNGTVSDVSGEYEAGTVVLLNAYPNSGYRVKYWSGADYAPATGNNSNIVTMNSHKTVSVGFEPLPPDTYELDVQIIGNGDVQPDGGVYDEGTIVVLTAYPQDGYRVKSWTDADNVPAFDTNINTVTITENKTVVVEFELIPVTVPAISAVTPDSGPAGSYVRISGDNFGDVSGNVFFDVLATDELVSWQNSEIFCRVPFGLASPAFLDVDVVRADDVNCAAVDAFELFQSVTIYVDVNNISGMENGTMQYPFSRIQSAVNSSIDDCNIFVLAGVYTGPGNRDISIDKIISLQSLDGPTVTTIDCEGAGRAFYLHDISDPNCLIRGFTMQNGSVPGDGGLLYLHQAWPTIEQCILTGGMAGGGLGGAVFCDGSSPYLVNCTIVDNNSADGRALSCVSDSNCGTATIINCILENDGNEIYIEGCSTVAAAYSDIFGGFGGVGNIDEDPCFADAVNGDYHLAPYSPCIDAGDPNSDFSLEPEPDGGRINMGAYGNTQEATSNGDLVLQSYNLVSKVRVGRTEFDYAYTMTLYNDGDVNLVDVQVELIDTPANVVLIDSLVEFLSIDAHSSAVSDDTFTIRVNTLTPIDVALISWRATFTLMGTSITYTTNMHSNHLVLEPVFGDVTNDGLVNMEDLWRLSLYWLDFDPQSDIAPPPLGDGIVNALDFALMAENWMNE
ncbi:MAG: hypothetical protein JW806_00880 [Sedimentisphaerales bacterium]|nr:hypothetical protein [Sedimentisphaerales bacterium]